MAKSVAAAGLAFLAILVAGIWGTAVATSLPVRVTCILLAFLSLAPGVVFAGGLVVLARQRRLARGEPDLFIALQESRREAGLDSGQGFRAGWLRRLMARMLLGHGMLPGDEVEIRPLPEILQTLDENGMLEGMPFQPEMIVHCGKRVRVFRCLDKIYDYGRTKQMRRLDHCVLLNGLRCDGGAHGGCQAKCYMIWRTEWLRPAAPGSWEASAAAVTTSTDIPQLLAKATGGEDRYRCQFTELHAATVAFPRLSARRDLVPLACGNYSLPAWLASMLTRAFNALQRLRGGLGYPPMPDIGQHASPECASLQPGQTVRVLPVDAIARTLDRRGKHRGLWFDVDMIKHCGNTFIVDGRIDKIIDDATGQMRTMKTPCITLVGIDYSGEGLHFNAQHDPTFWREYWLEPVK